MNVFLPSYGEIISFPKSNSLFLFKEQNKVISLIALTALICLAACSLLYYSLNGKKIFPKNDSKILLKSESDSTNLISDSFKIKAIREKEARANNVINVSDSTNLISDTFQMKAIKDKEARARAVINETVLVEQITKEQTLENEVTLKKEVTFQDFLNNYLESDVLINTETKMIILKNYPALNKIIEEINHTIDKKSKIDLMNALYVLAGIKPVLQFYGKDNQNFVMIKNLFKSFSNLKFVQDSSNGYLINEKPLAKFDPRKFILDFDKNYSSIEKAVTYAFPNQMKKDTAKLLSYILGYGPTWEAFNRIPSNALSIFTDEHYYQLGKALNEMDEKSKKKNLSKEELIKKGKNHSLNYQKWWLGSDSGIIINKLYMYQVLDEISLQTDYIQTGIKYRKKILNLFNIDFDTYIT